jgi:hypothetical protein
MPFLISQKQITSFILLLMPVFHWGGVINVYKVADNNETTP